MTVIFGVTGVSPMCHDTVSLRASNSLGTLPRWTESDLRTRPYLGPLCVEAYFEPLDRNSVCRTPQRKVLSVTRSPLVHLIRLGSSRND